jgi:small basic protein
LEPNLAGMFLGYLDKLNMFSVYTQHLSLIVFEIKDEKSGPIGTKLNRNVPWMVLYKVTVFRSSRIFNMAARANNML